MKEKKSFWVEWLIFLVIIALLVWGAKALINSFIGWSSPWCWIVVPIIFCTILFRHRLIVPQEHEVVFEWHGEVVRPLSPGIYFPFSFSFLGLLSEGADVLMNHQILHILTGSRNNLSDDLKKDYVYGSQSDIQPGTGAALRLMYDVEVMCVDSVKLVYNFADSYQQVASLVEKEVIKYVHDHDGEYIYDHFISENWNLLINEVNLDAEDTGIRILNFIPKNILDTPEVEESRAKVELEKRKGEILREKLKNKNVEEEIAKKDDQIRNNSINAIIGATGVSGDEALKHVIQEKKLNAMIETSGKGNITYLDSSNGNAGAAFGWGFNATRERGTEKETKTKTE